MKEKRCINCGGTMREKQGGAFECLACKGKSWKYVWRCPRCHILLMDKYCVTCHSELDIEY